MNNSSVIDKRLCSGCNACAEICPRKCIKMEYDSAGFLYPVTDNHLCNNCGLCIKVCHTKYIRKQEPLKAYAARSNSDVQQKGSSSGGIADILSRFILSHGGVVYGCVFNKTIVQHQRIDNIKDVERLKGSKYVQSELLGVFSLVKRDLQQFMKVLFIGTPCQIAALRSFLGRDYNNLYLVDLVCHGVPSQRMFNDYLDSIVSGKEIRNISFRNGSQYLFTVETTDCRYAYNLWTNRYGDTFMNAFIDGVTLRESCYSCQYASVKRVSDITLGDFWGLKDVTLFSNREGQGISLVLPCSDKGSELIEQIKGQLEIFERPVQEAVDGNSGLRCAVAKSLRVCIFNELYKYLPFNIAVRFSLVDRYLMTTLRKIKRMINVSHR